MSYHLRSNKKSNAPLFQTKQIDCLYDFSENYTNSILFGDSNIGSTKKFDKMNKYLDKKFVDALDLNCNKKVNKSEETTYLFRDI